MFLVLFKRTWVRFMFLWVMLLWFWKFSKSREDMGRVLMSRFNVCGMLNVMVSANFGFRFLRVEMGFFSKLCSGVSIELILFFFDFLLWLWINELSGL